MFWYLCSGWQNRRSFLQSHFLLFLPSVSSLGAGWWQTGSLRFSRLGLILLSPLHHLCYRFLHPPIYIHSLYLSPLSLPLFLYPPSLTVYGNRLSVVYSLHILLFFCIMWSCGFTCVCLHRVDDLFTCGHVQEASHNCRPCVQEVKGECAGVGKCQLGVSLVLHWFHI